MIILGWISLIILAGMTLVSIGRSESSGGERIVAVTLNTVVLVYIIWTLKRLG